MVVVALGLEVAVVQTGTAVGEGDYRVGEEVNWATTTRKSHRQR